MFIEKTIEINGQKIFYLHQAAAGQALVILHGFPGSHLGLLPFAKSIDEKYQVILPDLPACGLSEPFTGSHRLEQYADWLKLFLEKIGVEKPVIIGHSFGARIALTFARQYPNIAGKYVFLMPVVRVEGWVARIVAFGYRTAMFLGERVMASFFSSQLYQTAAYYISIRVFKLIDPKERDEIIRRNNLQLKELPPRIHWEMFREFYQKDLTGLAEFVQVPSLVIAGSSDIVATLGSVRGMAKRLKYGYLEAIRGAGHLLPFEQPRQTAEIMEKWISGA